MIPSFVGCTGRTHQLRRHAAMIGHPILGDRKYHTGWAVQKQREMQSGPGPCCSTLQQVSNTAFPHGAAADTISLGVRAQPACAAVADMDMRNGSDDGADNAGTNDADNADNKDGADSGPHHVGDAEGSAHQKDPSRIMSDPAGSEHLCLWAVQVQLQHPVTLEALDVCIPEPSAYGAVRAAHAISVAP